MKSFICEMFYKQRAAFEQSCASRGKEYPLPEDVFLQSDIFYDESQPSPGQVLQGLGVLAVEMEAAALYLNAARLGKNALTICTISDNPFTGEELDAEARQNTFTQMMEIALEIA